MSEEVKMPQMGESIAEGTIVKWLKQVGDAVKRDEPLFEISTDKVDAEIPSPSSGVLSQIMVKEGETVAVNTIVAVINGGAAAPAEASKPAPKEEPKKAAEPAKAKEPAAPAPPPEPKAAAPAPHSQTPAAPPAPTAAAAPPSKDDTRGTRSSPVVRKIAEEHGIDISQIEGTGIGGRVTKQDILSFVENRGAGAKAEPSAPAAAPAPPAAAPPAGAPQRPPQPLRAPSADLGEAETLPQPFVDGDRVEIEPMSVMRRRIAERMVESRHISAHVTSFMEVDFTKTAKLRESMKADFERDGVKLTFMPFIIKAVIEAIKKWPVLNSSVWGDQIVFKKDINVGVAVALDWGLIVPVIRGADEKSLLGLARA